MKFYKLYIRFGMTETDAAFTVNENGSMTSFSFDPANTDYQQFKIQVADGTPLEDPDGNTMTQEQVDEFLRTIP